jgi:uncharacterized protein
MKSIRLICCLLVTAGLLTKGYAQQKPAGKLPPKPGIRKARLMVAARATKDQIILRWAPDDELAWKQANQYGYMVERFTVSRNDTMLKKIERVASRGLIKPAPLAKWDSIANKNDYAAVIAQAIYGDDFDVSVSDNQGVAKFINETEQLKQRYSMSLYAADLSFDAARYAGLAWVDKQVKPNEKYLYRVYTVVPKTRIIIDTALVYIGLADYKPLPKPSDIYADFGDKNVILSWDFDSYVDYYNSYYVERSADSGKTFSRVTDLPLTKLNKKDSSRTEPGIVLFIDSLADNKINYQYRISGVSPFGETGPYSEVIEGKGRTLLAGTPHITGAGIDDKGKIELNWFFEDSLNALIKGFELKASEKIDGEYKTVKDSIAPGERKAVLNDLPPSAYLMVTAIPLEGEARTSYPYLVQPEDSLAPAIPQDFTGSIDTTGVVTLKWKENTEKDLLGYKIFRTYVKGNEYSTVIDSVWYQSEYRDTLALKNLNHKVYYTVTALDKRYNQSPFAPEVEIEKPDVIPPSQPVFSSYELKENELLLQWINSSDPDVATNSLYRREIISDSATGWQKILEVKNNSVQQYTDKLALTDRTYAYTLIAKDSAGLESPPASPLTLFVPTPRQKDAIRKLELEADRDKREITINWESAGSNVIQFELYRAEDKDAMNLYKVLNADEKTFTDKELRVNTTYKYAVRAIYKDGKYSDFKMKNIIY